MSLTVTKPAAEMRLIREDGHETATPVADTQHKLIWRDAEGHLWQCPYFVQDRVLWEGQETVQSVRVFPRSRVTVEYVEFSPSSVRVGDVCLTPAGGPHVWRYETLSGPIGLPAAMQVRKTLVGPADSGAPLDVVQMGLDEWAALGGDYYTREAAPPVIVRARAASPSLAAVAREHAKQVELFAEADQDSASAKRLQDAAVLILMCAVGFLNYTPLHVLFAAFSARHDDADFVARVRKILDKHGDDRQALQRIAAALTISAMDASTRASEVT